MSECVCVFLKSRARHTRKLLRPELLCGRASDKEPLAVVPNKHCNTVRSQMDGATVRMQQYLIML